MSSAWRSARSTKHYFWGADSQQSIATFFPLAIPTCDELGRDARSLTRAIAVAKGQREKARGRLRGRHKIIIKWREMASTRVHEDYFVVHPLPGATVPHKGPFFHQGVIIMTPKEG